MFHEYPKALYNGGALDGELRIVGTPHEEAELRKQGFASLGESNGKQEEPKKRGRKPKEAS